MRVYFRDGCAWFAPDYEPTDDERLVLHAITVALPDTLQSITVNDVCEYVLVEQGYDEALERPWSEYYFNVQGGSELPLKGV